MSTMLEVTQKDMHDLFKIFERKSFDAGSCEKGSLEENVINRCELLFKGDYTLIELDNSNGVLCPRYPSRIFIPEYEHGHMAMTVTANSSSLVTQATNNASYPQNSTAAKNLPHIPPSPSNSTESDSTTPSTSSGIQSFVTFANSATNEQTSYPSISNSGTNNTASNTIYEDQYDVNKIQELLTMAKYARCRQRFAVPVMMYRGKYICRSATVSINAETYGRKVVDLAYDCLSGATNSEQGSQAAAVEESNDSSEDSLMKLDTQIPFSYEEVIKSDIQLLNALNVTTIIDLMVEKRKIKYLIAVSSSEKADPDKHYENFNLVSLPYPGCEFFKIYRDNNYEAEKLYYDWEQPFNNANISVPESGPIRGLDIEWNNYKTWDLVQITQNYLKACLKCIKDENSGLLIHCISGWDRTPLFISLVRLSLWADGLIHQSLNSFQMAYFTVAYDWYLFGHQLSDRFKRGEDILFFCFFMLKYITGDEFSISGQRRRTKTSSSSGSSIVVLKTDSGDETASLRESMISDLDSNESYSNSSNCDNLFSTDRLNAPVTSAAETATTMTAVTQALKNRSPNSKRSKTSPISVPGASDTNQADDWQMVTVTGSIESCSSVSSFPRRMASQQDSSANSDNTGGNPSVSIKQRMQRLTSVRAIVMQAYGKEVGLRFKEGSTSNLASLIGTISEQFF